jgi:hypothetical protein
MTSRAILSRTLCLICLLLSAFHLRAQQAAPPAFASNTTLTSSSPTLMLPGSVNLTSVVAAPKGGGLPTGKVSFFYDGTNALGTAPLTILPKTQLFPAGLSIAFNFGTNPFAFWADSLNGTTMDLAVSDLSQTNQEGGPVLTIIPALGKGQFNTAAEQTVQTLPENNYIDAIASGNFKNDGKKEFLLHLIVSGESEESGPATGQFAVVDSTLNTTLIPTPLCGENDTTCTATDPDVERLVVDDFTGDGFSDVASLVTTAPPVLQNFAFFDSLQVTQPIIRIGVNNGSATAIGFTFGANAVLPTFPDVNTTKLSDLYCPNAIASGQFRKGGSTDVVSVGQQSTYTANPTEGGFVTFGCTAPINTGHLVLLLGDGKGGLTAQTPITLGSNPAAVGVGDFNKDGNLDVVVADATDNTVQIFYGNGDGTFVAQPTVAAGNSASSLRVADFNGDGYPDVVISDSGTPIFGDGNTSGDGNTYVLMNDGTGKLLAPVPVYQGAQPSVTVLSQDMNGDGLPDVTVLTPPPPGSQIVVTGGAIAVQLSTASAQAVLATAPQTLPLGNHTLTATYPGDLNFATSTSLGVPIAVIQSTPVITWAAPAAIEYGTPLSAAQLNATASVAGGFAYTPGAGAILPPGMSTIATVFTPTDTFDYAAVPGSVSITVTPPSLTAISPTTANQGSAAFTLTVTGQGFRQGATVLWNGTALATTYVSLNQFTAVVPATSLTATGKSTVTVVDPGALAVGGSQAFTVIAPAAVASAAGPATTDPETQPTVQLSLNSYPAPVTVNLTLTFTPATAGQPDDPTVLFANGTTTDTFVIPANSTAAIPPVNLQAGSTAGNITIGIQLIANGVDITPAALVPVVIAVPAVAPIINSVTITRTGQTMNVVITGLSSPRDMAQAQFQFDPAPGASLKTKELTVTLNAAFTTWYQNQGSTAFGTAFQYTQPFTLDSPATDVQSVTVTLTNSVGASQSATAQ